MLEARALLVGERLATRSIGEADERIVGSESLGRGAREVGVEEREIDAEVGG